VLRELHGELDLAVADAYGWPVDLPAEELLARLVALNANRAGEEARGEVRWLRPELQAPAAAAPAVQLAGLDGEEAPEEDEEAATAAVATLPAPAKRQPWPKKLPEQVTALRVALGTQPRPATPAELAAAFTGAKADRVAELLEALVALGHVRQLPDGRVVG